MSLTCAVSQAQTTNVATSMAPPFRYNHQQVFCQFGCPVSLRWQFCFFEEYFMLHSTVVAGEAEEVTDDAGDIVVEGAGGGTGEAVKSKLEGAAEGVTIPHICHFFTPTHFEAWKLYTQKCGNLRQKFTRDKQRKLHTMCKITHCV